MIDAGARVRLADRVRLKLDRHSGKQVLLAPERALELNDMGARVVALCDEERLVGDIVERLVALAGDTPRTRIEAEVLDFLRALEVRGLLQSRQA